MSLLFAPIFLGQTHVKLVRPHKILSLRFPKIQNEIVVLFFTKKQLL
ncbi:hypothetical protein LEP1GSC072_3130 [Leptospira noguchii str. Bonito]|nr:hypothetical protein LEP1GSC072_3130 [Leptospira noguchii str. Bonito]